YPIMTPRRRRMPPSRVRVAAASGFPAPRARVRGVPSPKSFAGSRGVFAPPAAIALVACFAAARSTWAQTPAPSTDSTRNLGPRRLASPWRFGRWTPAPVSTLTCRALHLAHVALGAQIAILRGLYVDNQFAFGSPQRLILRRQKRHARN